MALTPGRIAGLAVLSIPKSLRVFQSPRRKNWHHLSGAVDWLRLAQERSPDRGVSEGYHLYHGWLPSYPETTGYIIETFFDCARLLNDEGLKISAFEMADWLVSTQNPDGSIMDSRFTRPLVFDTGQVLFGFVEAFQESGDPRYESAARKAGAWILNSQSGTGAWEKGSVGGLPHTYYSRVAWSLLRLFSLTNEEPLRRAAERNLSWVLGQQLENGWYRCAGFSEKGNEVPYTHTIAYTIRGLLEAGLQLANTRFFESAKNAADRLLEAIPESGRLPGRFDKNWVGDSRFSCLTGNAQLAIILFKLYGELGDDRYLEAGLRLNAFLKEKQAQTLGFKDLRGGIPGSDPIWGRYIRYCLPNWAAKFFADSLILEEAATGTTNG